MKSFTASFVLVAAMSLTSAVQADTLLIERVQAERSAPLPARGTGMAQVEARFGAPAQKFPAVAGPNDRRHNPPITRWAYPTFTVYFENDHVVDAVLVKASPEEIGPAPAQK